MAQEQFGSFTASELYCGKCKRSQPVRERLLLVLPSGELHEFLCTVCGTSLGKRTVTGPVVAARPANRPRPGHRTREGVFGDAVKRVPASPGQRKLLR